MASDLSSRNDDRFWTTDQRVFLQAILREAERTNELLADALKEQRRPWWGRLFRAHQVKS